MNFEERALTLRCNGSWMYGILSLPERTASRGVLIVVGGPQYRVGSHRQFTLLARHLASLGIPVLRFDYRGMGDSEGAPRTFEDLEDDLHCAIERFFEEAPALSNLVIWGLCDAASAALFHAHLDPRITGLVLLNPWVRTDQGAAKAYLKHYYLTRLLDPEFWSKVWNGRFNYANAAQSLAKTVEKVLPGRKIAAGRDTTGDGSCDFADLPERMLNALSRYKGKILLITSGNDLTAQEFLELVKGSREWQQLLAPPHVTHRNLPEANHTFSRREWRDQVADWTKEWLYTW
ncbi:exosortase A system-associated hydrolase 1 [Nitrosospira sp. Nsp11]|uniref:hydrolase 1, exosortase A system-associated n=1 Tax=Nitrosospira sp. Nsp11 TaxID=1855338 RepID=UPI0009191C96|nr:hydrolase 1, exosortase A system-associated [Nitrosospira sp. Nsp11]SHL99634.1 exosortase A system-associated hydrolase 1 [Nitrosospira sp. Nsp11]